MSCCDMAGMAFLVSMASFLCVVGAGQLRRVPAGGGGGGQLPGDLFSLGIASKISTDGNSTAMAASDFGHMVEAAPEAVLHPASAADIAALVRFSASSPAPFPVAPRGQGHSANGQALSPGGVVVDMRAMAGGGAHQHHRINVSAGSGAGQQYVDAGGEQLWVDVLRAALEHGLTPRVWTDYLSITVGGTLSNAGIGGQAFRHGPQIANVLELDVVTGTGATVTCSSNDSPDLFFAALGGLGQFGVITRARIALERAPRRVRWLRLAYSDAAAFTRDQELLISRRAGEAGFNYVEGQVQLRRTLTEGSKSSRFFSGADLGRLAGLAAESSSGTVYLIEAAMYYDYYDVEATSVAAVEQELEAMLEQLSFSPGFVFAKDVTYVHFLDRVGMEEEVLRSAGVWDVPHPWLNLFVPRSRILDFDASVLRGILAGANPVGLILMYPMNAERWDDRMTAVTPPAGEDVFYTVGLLRSAVAPGDLEQLQRENEAVLAFCNKEGIECKQYLPCYTSQEGWRRHFGAKWGRITELKAKYDPHAIMSPGQRIFPRPAAVAVKNAVTL